MKKLVLLGTILCLFLVGLVGCGGNEQSITTVNPTGNSATTLGQTEQSEYPTLVYASTDEPTATSEQNAPPALNEELNGIMISDTLSFRARVLEFDSNYSLRNEESILFVHSITAVDSHTTDGRYFIGRNDSVVVLNAHGENISYSDILPDSIVDITYYGLVLQSNPAIIPGAITIQIVENTPTGEPQATSEQSEYPTSAYAPTGEPQATSGQSIVTASHIANNFVLSLFADKEVYSTTEAIQIWATLEYLGNDESVEIWHGSPAIIFTVEGEDGFYIGGSVSDVLLYTVLQRGHVYNFDFQKSGGWCADSPNAYFWENFFAEPNLFLPAGEYTIAVIGAFSFTERMTESPSGLRSEIRIRVE